MSQLDAFTIDETFGCHIWHSKVGNNGRPIVWRGRTPVNAYKLAYEDKHGPVPEGLVLDHLCRRASAPNACVNPAHLEAVTQHENLLRRNWGYRCRMRTCPKGHSLATAMVTPELGRLCRECHGKRI